MVASVNVDHDSNSGRRRKSGNLTSLNLDYSEAVKWRPPTMYADAGRSNYPELGFRAVIIPSVPGPEVSYALLEPSLSDIGSTIGRPIFSFAPTNILVSGHSS